jgi:selenide,water dikinase
MTTLYKIGVELSKIKGVTAMTDVTGFGFLGHLIEMAEGSGLSAEIYYDKIPVAAGAKEYITQRIFPDATTRNWSSYGDKVKFEKGVNVMEAFTLLPDPQTNGGLLVSVREASVEEVKKNLGEINPIGIMTAANEKIVWVK